MNVKYPVFICSSDSWASTVTMLRTGEQENRSSISDDRYFPFLQNIQSGYKAHPPATP